MDIVTREEWGARPPKHAYHEIALYQPRLILHHAAGALLPGDDTVSDQDLRRIRSIQNYHQNTQGWNDIAYSFLLDPDGHLFEGRGAGVANGATKGYGAISYAVCVMGNYDTQTPEPDLVEGLAEVVRWGYDQGWWPLGFTGGHRDYGSTSCPGSKLYPLIPEINRLAQEETMPLTQSDADLVVNTLMARGLRLTSENGKPVPFELAASRNYRNSEYLTAVARAGDAVTDVDLDDAVDQLLATLPDRVVTRLQERLGNQQ